MKIIDSHTEGEPTRVIVGDFPDLGRGSMAERRARFSKEFDHLRRQCILEPRGHDAIVGALLCEPVDPSCAAGVIFFNNVGMLNMCGHGTIGLAVTLAYMGRIGVGQHRFETPVGPVEVMLLSAHEAQIQNVPSYRYREEVSVQVPGYDEVVGDIAWGGNWFFLCAQPPCAVELAQLAALTQAAQAIADALEDQGIRGEDGGRIDHIEFFAPPKALDANSRNFVLCPGGAYDRSPCGTGTSAKLACLAADGKLAPEQIWVQESVIGSRFQAFYTLGPEGKIIPHIKGRAYVVSESSLIAQPQDPFADGIVSA